MLGNDSLLTSLLMEDLFLVITSGVFVGLCLFSCIRWAYRKDLADWRYWMQERKEAADWADWKRWRDERKDFPDWDEAADWADWKRKRARMRGEIDL